MNLSATTKWISLALLGLAIAALVAVAASNLVSRQIGIASESVSAGNDLAPAVESAARQNTAGANGSGRAGGGPAAGPSPSDDNEDSGSESGGSDGPVSAQAERDRLKEREDALKEGEDAREDALKEQEDALDDAEDAREDALKELEDNSGHGSDD